MAGKVDCLKELNVAADATPYGSEFQTPTALGKKNTYITYFHDHLLRGLF